MFRIKGVQAKIEHDIFTNLCGQTTITKTEDQGSSQAKLDVEKEQIDDLLCKLPKLGKILDVHRKIGEGTFSSVYLGSLKAHAALPKRERRWFAIKHLVPTAHPARVEHELRCLQNIGGEDHVIGVELCLRNFDTIVFIMPYIPHKKFSEYVDDMDAEELRRYMRALLLALRRVHAHHVIHRDIKPSNFLYDRHTQRYQLVDFGLAQRVCSSPEPPSPAALRPTKRPRDRDDLPRPKRPARGRPTAADARREEPNVDREASHARRDTASDVRSVRALGAECACAGAGGVCGACRGRGAVRAPRAGTQGFRPPEVLLKHKHQTTAVDMWACGVVLTSALLGRYPLLRAADDLTALAEMAALVGTGPLRTAARALGRRLVTSCERRGLCLRKLCRHVRSGGGGARAGAGGARAGAGGARAGDEEARCSQCGLSACVCRDPARAGAVVEPGAWWGGFPDEAFSLAARLLDPAPATRITAAQALLHPFIVRAWGPEVRARGPEGDAAVP